MHACACVCMVENDKKRSKIIQNILFSSCARDAHVKGHVEILILEHVLHFRPCERIRKHEFASQNTQQWSNYKTIKGLGYTINTHGNT